MTAVELPRSADVPAASRGLRQEIPGGADLKPVRVTEVTA